MRVTTCRRSLARVRNPSAHSASRLVVYLSKTNMKEFNRCAWAKSELMVRYHDEEWGVPLHDDGMLFEFLLLEGAQAGLSWETILKKRENYRRAFDNFDARKVAKYNAREIKRLLADAGIVRNRLKIAASIHNAKAFLAIQKEFGTFNDYIWRFIGGRPIRNHRK